MEGGTTSGFWDMDLNTTYWETEQPVVTSSCVNLTASARSVFMILDLVTLIFALGGLVGNMIVLWLLGFCIQRNAFSVYILNLAGADVILLSCEALQSVQNFVCIFHVVTVRIPHFMIMVKYFSYSTGLSLLSAISTERCLSVLCPIWYRCHRPRHTSAAMCTLLWALALLLNVLEADLCGLLFRVFKDGLCQAFDFITATWMVFLFVVLCGSSLALLLRVHCFSARAQPVRLYVTILLTVLAFLLCGLPLGIHWFLFHWTVVYPEDIKPYLIGLWNLLSCVNSCANPIIYFFVGSFRQRRARKTLKLILQRALRDGPEMEDSEGNLPLETKILGSSANSDLRVDFRVRKMWI